MPREATGSVYENRGAWFARIMLDKRAHVALPTCKSEEQASARKDVLAGVAKRLRAAGHGGEDGETLLRRLAEVPEGKPLENLLAGVDRLVAGQYVTRAKPDAKPTTFGDIASQWVSGELARKYPDHVKVKRSADSDEHRFKHVLPLLATVPISAFELEHADRAMATLPPMSTASRRHIAQVIHRVLAIAVYPLKLIKASPIPPGWLPKLGPKIAKAYLYPDEDARLLGCVDIPIAWRLLYGFLHREGMRRSEALSLQWHDVDLVRGALALDKNKTDDPRAWALRPDVVEALCAWWKLRGGPGPDEYVFVDDAGHALTDDHTADRYRAHLETAGIARRQLFERSSARRRITFHDTRATFVTIALANGKTEAWVKARTGHRSSDQIATYQRAAQMVTELDLGDLLPLVEIVPELAGSGSESAAAQETLQNKANVNWIQVPAGSLLCGFKSRPSHQKSEPIEPERGVFAAGSAKSTATSADSAVSEEPPSRAAPLSTEACWWGDVDRLIANDLFSDAEGS